MRTHYRKLLDENKLPRSTASRSTTTPQPSDPLLSFTTTTTTTTANNTNTTTNTSTAKIKPNRQTTLGFDSSMALTALFLLTALFFMIFFSMYFRRFAAAGNNSTIERRRRQQQQRRSSSSLSSSSSYSTSTSNSSFSSSKGLDLLTVKSLPLFAYDGEAKEQVVDCVVCLSEFEERETVKMIPYCGHLFHPECIDMWFSSHISCPVCRSTRLFGSTDFVKKKKKSKAEENNLEKVFDLEQGVGECTVEISTVRSDDTYTDQLGGRSEEDEEESWGVIRRSSSWSSLGEKVLLTRSFSF